MSDATLLAGELADIAAGLERLREALAGVNPQMTVQAPEVTIPPSVVNVAPSAAVVMVEPTPISVAAPVVNVAAPTVSIGAPEAVGYTVRIIDRDRNGLIQSFRITPT